jgi:hypothetical protein
MKRLKEMALTMMLANPNPNSNYQDLENLM